MKPAGIIAGLTLGLLVACEPSSPPNSKQSSTQNSELPFPTEIFIEQGSQSLQQLQLHAGKLKHAVNAFLNQSNQQHWQALREQWITNHQHWHHSQLYLAAYPIDQNLIDNLHSEPITPGYLDHIEGYSHSGIVHDSSLALNLNNIRQQHRSFSDEEASLGIHVLEFLIWGRQLEDYTQGQNISQAQIINGLKQYQLPTPRRREYLKLLTELWQQDIAALQLYWQEQSDTLNEQHPESLRLFLSQQIGRLANNQHSEFSHDLSWQLAVLSATQNQISKPLILEKIAPLIKTLTELNPVNNKPVTDEQYASINQQLGKLMLVIQNRELQTDLKKPVTPAQK